MDGDTNLLHKIPPDKDEVINHCEKVVYYPKCSGNECLSDEDEYKLECVQCQKLFHYACTQLPLYQLSYFLIKGYRRYVCPECTVVPDYVLEIMAKSKPRTPAKSGEYNIPEITETETISRGCQIGTGWKSLEQIENDYKRVEDDLDMKNTEIQRILDEKRKIKSENIQLKQTMETYKEHQEVLRKSLATKDNMLAKYKNNENKQSTQGNSSSDINGEIVTELTSKVNKTLEENEAQKLSISTLTNKHRELRAIIQQQTEASKEDKHDLAQLKHEISEYEKSMRSYEESEAHLRDTITRKQKELEVQEEKFNEVGNPAYDSMVKLEETMTRKIEQIGKTLEHTLLKHVKDNNQQIEERLNEVVNHAKTYAGSVSNDQVVNVTPLKPTENVSLRTIMNEAKNEELAEEREKKLRACNIILHGVKEPNNENKTEAKLADETYISEFLDAVEVQVTCKYVARLGKHDTNKRRPIKLVMNSEDDKRKVMENLRKLKDNNTFFGLSVAHDYTIAERELTKEFSEKAKERNDNEPQDSKYIWKIRGNPKNGLHLKKLLKIRPPVQRITLEE